MRFRDRAEAGRQLASVLLPYRGESLRVLGMARGGVRVGIEVSRALSARLEVWVARRIVAPRRPDLVVGGVAEGGAVLLDVETLRAARLPEGMVARWAEEVATEVRDEVERLRDGRPPPDVRGCTVILVDDVALTGTTARVALRSLRQAGPRRLIFAAPVASTTAMERLRREADAVSCLELVPGLRLVSEAYADARPVPELEVLQLLQRGREPPSSREVIESADTGGVWI
jgi:predicted phosphoribosyltransferase